MTQTLRTLKRRLVNLSGGNKALCHLRLQKASDLDVHELGFLNGMSADAVLEQVLFGRKSVPLCAVYDSRSAESNTISARLGKIARQAELLRSESGIYNLYIGLWFATGFLQENVAVRAPLVLIPVRLTTEQNMRKIKRDEAEAPFLNPVFLLAYAHVQKQSLAESLLQWSYTDEAKITDMISLKTAVYELLRDEKIDVNFKDTFFEPALEPFALHTKEHFEQTYRNTGLQVQRSAVLGIYTGIDSALQTDFDHLLNEDVALEQLFHNAETPNPVKLEDCYTPFDFDSFQLQTIQRIKKGASMVVQGPPGTGKSQLLANIAADAIASGKRTLIVCQKKTALDVIYKRLSEHRLEQFAALVHDHRHERKDVYHKIATQIELIERYVQENKQLDTVITEREYIQTSRYASQLLMHFEQFRAALFTATRFGVSALELYKNIRKEPVIINDECFASWDLPMAEEIFRKMKRVLELRKANIVPITICKNRSSFHNLQEPHKLKMLQYLKHAVVDLETIKIGSKSIHRLLTDPVMHNLLLTLLPHANTINKWAAWHKKGQNHKIWAALLQQDTLKNLAQEQARAWIALHHTYPKQITLLEVDELEWHLDKTLEISKLHSTFIGKILWRFKAKHYQSTILFLNNHFAGYQNWAEAILKLKIHQQKIVLHRWFVQHVDIDILALPEPKDLELLLREAIEFTNWLENIINTTCSTLKLEEWDELLSDLAIHQEAVQRLCNLPEGITMAWLSEWSNTPSAIDNTIKALQHHFESLVAIDQTMMQLPSPCHTHLLTLEQELADKSSHERIAYYKNAVLWHWLQIVESEHPELKEVSNGLFEQNLQELHQLMDKRQKLLAPIIQLKAREHTCRIVRYNKLNNRITYRELLHQTTKKKRIWPLRQLIAQFEDEVFQLMPVWLCSPESAAAMFEMRPIFDLVLFDEASQCFVEKGVPIAYRAKQVVVVGDAQQLQPTDLYQVKYDDEQHDDSSAEVESLLNLAALYLPNTLLANHYRSKAPELIQFSNEHFYHNQLICLPEYTHLKQKVSAFEYLHVSGQWKNQTNEAEAHEVVHIVKRLLPEIHQGKSLCIATFNFPQSELIKELLEWHFALDDNVIPEGVMVKNIENIQGDEADILVFSVGYARDEEGTLRLQFGSLSQAGGENRLNVAITRAREKIVIVSSLLPHELNTQNTMHRGPRLLQQYLAYAYAQADSKKQHTNELLNENEEVLIPKAGFVLSNLSSNTITLTDEESIQLAPDAAEAFYHLPKRLERLGWAVTWRWSRNK
jgi:ABC-type ATPase involved in cell division